MTDRVYKKSGRYIEGIPVYVDESGIHAVWSPTGEHPWIVGNLTDLDSANHFASNISTVNVLDEKDSFSICKN